MIRWRDRIPKELLIVIALFISLAPFQPEPHTVQKPGMLAAGMLTRPLEALDLLRHSASPAILATKLARMAPGAQLSISLGERSSDSSA